MAFFRIGFEGVYFTYQSLRLNTQDIWEDLEFIVVDNNDAKEDMFREVSKRIKGLLRKPVKNGRARQWIKNQLDLKRR